MVGKLGLAVGTDGGVTSSGGADGLPSASTPPWMLTSVGLVRLGHTTCVSSAAQSVTQQVGGSVPAPLPRQLGSSAVLRSSAPRHRPFHLPRKRRTPPVRGVRPAAPRRRAERGSSRPLSANTQVTASVDISAQTDSTVKAW